MRHGVKPALKCQLAPSTAREHKDIPIQRRGVQAPVYQEGIMMTDILLIPAVPHHELGWNVTR